MSVDLGSKGLTGFDFNSSAKKHPKMAGLEDPQTSRVRLQELIVYPMVLNLFIVFGEHAVLDDEC